MIGVQIKAGEKNALLKRVSDQLNHWSDPVLDLPCFVTHKKNFNHFLFFRFGHHRQVKKDIVLQIDLLQFFLVGSHLLTLPGSQFQN